MFKVGDDVICINTENTKLKGGVVYRVVEIDENKTDKTQNRISVHGTSGWFFADRFELSPVLNTHEFMPKHLANETTNVVPITQGASKNDQSKIDLSLIPKVALEECAKAFMVGERKYNRYNYCKGHKASQLIAAAMRHIAAWNEGEETDPVDGQHHLGSVMACCAMILRQAQLGTLKDDRYANNKK